MTTFPELLGLQSHNEPLGHFGPPRQPPRVSVQRSAGTVQALHRSNITTGVGAKRDGESDRWSKGWEDGKCCAKLALGSRCDTVTGKARGEAYLLQSIAQQGKLGRLPHSSHHDRQSAPQRRRCTPCRSKIAPRGSRHSLPPACPCPVPQTSPQRRRCTPLSHEQRSGQRHTCCTHAAQVLQICGLEWACIFRRCRSNLCTNEQAIHETHNVWP